MCPGDAASASLVPTAMRDDKEYVQQIAASFGVKEEEVRRTFHGAAASTWKILAKVSDPPPWSKFIERLNGIPRPRKGPTAKNGAPSYRQVQDALNNTVQQYTNVASTRLTTAPAYSTRGQRESTGAGSSNSDFLRMNNIGEHAESQPSEASRASPQRVPALPMEMETVMATAITAATKTLDPRLVLKKIRDDVQRAVTRMDEIKAPTVAHAERLEKIDAQIQDCFQRFRYLQPGDDDKAIQEAIVQHAGVRRMLEITGLQDAAEAFDKQNAAALQLLSDQLITALGPAVVKQSLQKHNTQRWQMTEGVPEPAHNGVCHSPWNTDEGSRDKRPREGSDEQERPNKRQTAFDHTTGATPHERIEAGCSAQGQQVEPPVGECCDVTFQSVASATRNEWGIRQIKTALFTSAESVTQRWSWRAKDECLAHQVRKHTKSSEWRTLPMPIQFDVQLKDMKEIQASATALRVYIAARKSLSSGSDEDEDVMVVFQEGNTVLEFLDFFRGKGIKITEREP